MSCTNNGPIQGGLITESRITDSKISDSTITNSTFDNGAVTGGVRLDEESATDIAAAVASHEASHLPITAICARNPAEPLNYQFLPEADGSSQRMGSTLEAIISSNSGSNWL